MDYLVYIRFEDSPAQARRHVMAAEQAGGSQYVLDARYQAVPGEETSILHEAFDAAFGLDKYITLYRGFPVGEDFRGRKLFTPVGLVWCKDRVELGQMLGLEMSYEVAEPYQPPATPAQTPDTPVPHFDVPVHSPWSQGGAKGMDWSRPSQSQNDPHGDWNSRWLDASQPGAENGRTEWGQGGSFSAGSSELSDDTLAGTMYGTRRNPVVQQVSRQAEAEPSRPASTATSTRRPNLYAENRPDDVIDRRPASEPSFDRDFNTRAERHLQGLDDEDEADRKRGGWWKWLLGFVVCLVGSFLIVYLGARFIAG